MKYFYKLLLILSITLIAGSSFADESALRFAKSRQEAIFSAGSRSLKEIDKTLDYDSLVVESMGANWDLATDSQKDDIKRLLRIIVRTSLQKRFSKMPSRDIKWLGEEDKDSALTIVKSVVEVKKPVPDEFEINYLVSKKTGSYRVVDVIFDGVSTVETYKHQFQKVIKVKGIQGLIEKLIAKAGDNIIDEDDGC